MKNMGSKKFILIALIIFILLVIAGFVLDRITRDESPVVPQARLYCCDIDVDFLDAGELSV